MDNLSFWGLFLIITGIALLARVLFNFDFPLFRVLAGVFLILLGVKIMLGNSQVWPFKTAENEIFFRSAEIGSDGELQDDYQVVFSHASFDLSGIKAAGKTKRLKISTVFSSTTVYLPAGVPLHINVDAVFAGVKMPGRFTPVFGRGTYTSDGFDPGIPHLNIEVSVVFGNVVLMYESP